MLIVLTALVFLLLGSECARMLARRHPAGPLEVTVWALVIAFTAWLGSLWALALADHLTIPALLTRTAAAAGAALLLGTQRRTARAPGDASRSRTRPAAAVLLAVAILSIWSGYVLWRAAVIPPLSHDALSYHLPKAVLYARAGGFEVFEALDSRARDIPANYEMLLAEFVLVDGTDRFTEWPSTLFFLALVIAGGALAERWWPEGRRLSIAAGALFTAGMPVVLLHSGMHKNDLMVSFFVVAGFVTGGRWLTTGERPAMLLSMAAFAMAAGTKPHGGLAALALLPFLTWRWWRRSNRSKTIGLALLAAVVLFPLLGGAVYLTNLAGSGDPGSPGAAGEVEGDVGFDLPVVYGDWRNLWQAPYVLIAAPFSRSPMALSVPWESEPWFWRRYDMYISHAGAPLAVCLLLLPLAVARYRRAEGPAAERIAVTVAALAAVIAMLPVVFHPHGFYAISLPRYLTFFFPMVFAWVVVPFVERSSARMAVLVMGVAAASFAWYAIDNVTFDDFVPPSYLEYAREHPGTRVIPFDPNRAASVADRAAGPYEVIAIEAAQGAWLLPAFGANLQRPVALIRAGAVPRIPDGVRWIVIDRGYEQVWGHPGMKDLSDVTRYTLRRDPAREGLLGALLADRRFEAVFYNPLKNQAVFRRVR